jgi:hypothetical protein
MASDAVEGMTHGQERTFLGLSRIRSDPNYVVNVQGGLPRHSRRADSVAIVSRGLLERSVALPVLSHLVAQFF